MPTRSVDPAGQHQLPITTSLTGGDKNVAYWNDRFHEFEVPFDRQCPRASDDPGLLPRQAEWLVAAGSDLLLQCEKKARGAAFTDDYIVRTYDSSGNALNVLGQFRDPESALASLPVLLTVAHMLYPNHLLMRRDASLVEPAQSR